MGGEGGRVAKGTGSTLRHAHTTDNVSAAI